MHKICIAFAFQGNVFEIRIRSGITFEDGCLTLICRLLIYIVRRSLPRHSAGVGNHAATARLPGRQPLLAHFIQSPSSHDCNGLTGPKEPKSQPGRKWPGCSSVQLAVQLPQVELLALPLAHKPVHCFVLDQFKYDG